MPRRKIKIAEVKRYIVTDGKHTASVDFIPVPDAPGFSHKIAINGTFPTPRSWLSNEFKPDKKAAKFFFEKHVLESDEMENQT